MAGLSPAGVRPCWAHQKKPRRSGAEGSSGGGKELTLPQRDDAARHFIPERGTDWNLIVALPVGGACRIAWIHQIGGWCSRMTRARCPAATISAASGSRAAGSSKSSGNVGPARDRTIRGCTTQRGRPATGRSVDARHCHIWNPPETRKVSLAWPTAAIHPTGPSGTLAAKGQ